VSAPDTTGGAAAEAARGGSATGVREAPTPIRVLSPADFGPAPRAAGARGPVRPSLSYWADAWIRLRRNRQALVSLFIVCALVAFTLVGPHLWRVDPAAQELTRISEGPSLGRTAVVRAEPELFEEITVAGVEAQPEVDGATLPAPASLEVVGEPTTLSVRLRWAAVPGAAGYRVYRSTEPPERDYLGLPMGEVQAGNVVSFEDTFNLEPRTYHYSVVATNVTDSAEVVTREVGPSSAVTLAAARAILPDAEIGETITFPRRPLGTDYLGRDLLARLMAGARVSLFIGFFAPLLATMLGVTIGGIAGYFGGRVDQWLMRITDFVLALPFLLFVILFRVVLGTAAGESGTTALIVALVALAWTGAARLTRGQVLQLREAEFVQASRLLGAGPAHLLARHLLPNTLGVILVSLTFAIPSAIFTEAFLSFIGMGVVPPTPSWGIMCNDGLATFLTDPHEFLFPALAISVTVLAFNLLGDGLRDALDPKMRSVG
jgi:oligopeptide transport system permease protein